MPLAFVQDFPYFAPNLLSLFPLALGASTQSFERLSAHQQHLLAQLSLCLLHLSPMRNSNQLSHYLDTAEIYHFQFVILS